METERIPWLFAILTAVWFWWMAYRAGRSPTLWAVGGAAFGLVLSALVIGLGKAASIPYSEHEREIDRWKWIVIALLLTIIVGWMLTSSLHRLHILVWNRFKGTSDGTAGKAESTPPAKPPGRPPG